MLPLLIQLGGSSLRIASVVIAFSRRHLLMGSQGLVIQVLGV